jgi:hypothetical protein
VVKKCLFCGRYFKPDRRVGRRQKACYRRECRKARKQLAQRKWCNNNPEYFRGRYWYVKEWRQRKRQLLSTQSDREGMIQDKIPSRKPLLKLILLIPEDKTEVIQDKILLQRVDRRTFVADGCM